MRALTAEEARKALFERVVSSKKTESFARNEATTAKNELSASYAAYLRGVLEIVKSYKKAGLSCDAILGGLCDLQAPFKR